jgi:hypothetical protein
MDKARYLPPEKMTESMAEDGWQISCHPNLNLHTRTRHLKAGT